MMTAMFFYNMDKTNNSYHLGSKNLDSVISSKVVVKLIKTLEKPSH